MKTENQIVEILALSTLFAGQKKEEIARLLELVGFQSKEYYRGEMIAGEGQLCRSLLIVLSGKVKGEMIGFSGKVLKIEDIDAPRPLAVAFLFGKNNRFPVTITAVETVEILIFPRVSVLKMMQNSEVFLTNFLNSVSGRAQFISERLRFLSFSSLSGKLANYLLGLHKEQNEEYEIHLKHTHSQLADLFGVTRPSLSRSLKDLQRRELIEVDGKRVRILNREELIRLLRE